MTALLEMCNRKIVEKRGDICAEQRERADHDKGDKHDDQAVFNQTLPFFVQDVIHHRPASSPLEYCFADLLERVGDVFESVVDTIAQQRDGRDHDDRNKRDDEAVFYHTLAFFILKELFHG